MPPLKKAEGSENKASICCDCEGFEAQGFRLAARAARIASIEVERLQRRKKRKVVPNPNRKFIALAALTSAPTSIKLSSTVRLQSPGIFDSYMLSYSYPILLYAHQTLGPHTRFYVCLPRLVYECKFISGNSHIAVENYHAESATGPNVIIPYIS